MKTQGLSSEQILSRLVADGLDRDYAEMVLANIENDIHDNRSFWKLFIGGLFITVCGLGINYYSWQIARNYNTAEFIVFWGIVVAGIIMIFRAFIIFKK